MSTPLIGLTGGIGSGKSTVASLFAKLGVPVIDADAISRQLSAAGGAAIPAIVQAFGEEALTAEGALNRAAMRARAFEHPADRERLEKILHPLIQREIDRLIAENQSADYLILEVPLLFESDTYRDRLTASVVVDCPVETQIERVQSRSGLARAQIAAILATQLSRDARLQRADYVIANDGELNALAAQVTHTHKQLMAQCKSAGVKTWAASQNPANTA